MPEPTDQPPGPAKDLTFSEAIFKTGWSRALVFALALLSMLVLYTGNATGVRPGYLDGVLQRLDRLYSWKTLLLVAFFVAMERLTCIFVFLLVLLQVRRPGKKD